MQISDRIASLKPSATLAVNNKAMSLRDQGVDVISLAVGEPNFPTPEHICRAAKEAIDQNFCRYTQVAGISELRKACADYYARVHNVSIESDCIMVSQGGKHCLYNFLQTFLNPADEVLLPAPYWVSYPDMVQLCEAKTVIVPSRVENGFKVTIDQLDAHLTPKTKLLILNSPNNPTGAVYNEEEYARIIEWAIAKKIFVLCDEIYEQLIFPPAKSFSAIRYMKSDPEYVACLNGVSKSFAMTGWRVGFICAHPTLIKKMVTLQGQCTSSISSISQKAALCALTGPLDCVAAMREAFQKRRDLGLNVIASWPKVVCPKPDGAFYFFADVHEYYKGGIANSTDFCNALLEKKHVAIVPGVAFGDDRCVRFSYAVSDETLLHSLDLIGAFLHDIA